MSVEEAEKRDREEEFTLKLVVVFDIRNKYICAIFYIRSTNNVNCACDPFSTHSAEVCIKKNGIKI